MEAVVERIQGAWSAFLAIGKPVLLGLVRIWNAVLWVPWANLIDIGLMTLLVYQVYIRLRGTRALRVLGGIAILGIGGMIAQRGGLFLTAWLLGGVGAAALLFVLIIFQAEIRQMLEQVNLRLPAQMLLRRVGQVRLRPESLTMLADALFALAAKRCGALCILERGEALEPLLSSPGTVVNAEFSSELLETIFTPLTPLHDGALYMGDGKVYRAGCVLPLTNKPDLASFYGTRHRAALGITEQSDALAIIVSEERGTVSVSEGGSLEVVRTPAALVTWLTSRLSTPSEQMRRRWFSSELFTHNWRPKVTAFAAVCLLWFVLVGRQDTEVGFSIPVVYTHMPKTLTLQDQGAQQVYVSVRGAEKMLSFVDPSRLRVTLALKNATAGRQRHAIKAANINLPPGLQVIGIKPSTILLHLRKKLSESPNPG